MRNVFLAQDRVQKLGADLILDIFHQHDPLTHSDDGFS